MSIDTFYSACYLLVSSSSSHGNKSYNHIFLFNVGTETEIEKLYLIYYSTSQQYFGEFKSMRAYFGDKCITFEIIQLYRIFDE